MRIRRARVWTAVTMATIAMTTMSLVAHAGSRQGTRLTAALGRPAAGAFPQRPSSIAWGRCDDPDMRAAQARCASLSVPLDYANPSGAQIRLAISRVKHTSSAAHYQGVILVNPGGPGLSGLSQSTMGALIPHGVGADYDWIGFDPRGVGSSTPTLSCKPNYYHADRPSYTPTSPADVRLWRARSRSYARACEEKNATLLPFMTTADSARDMDSIRQGLGVDRISDWGAGYGTYLGQVYATLFPSHVDRMVFDSSVDPRTPWYATALSIDPPIQRTLGIWFRWVAKYWSHYHLGRTARAVRRRFETTEAGLADHPAGGVVGPAEWVDVFMIVPMFRQYEWPAAADVFASWVHHHDASTLIEWYQGLDAPGYDNYAAANLAVLCTDAPWPTSWSRWFHDASAMNEAAPFSTWANVWYYAPCLYWPVAPSPRVLVDGGSTRALLIDETLDAPTPFHGDLEVRARFPESRLIAVRGGTSFTNTISGNHCVDDPIVEFLKNGSLPPRRSGRRADVTCPTLPLPTP
jgi:pimeloyl-ACP methyl ester carboxylesterase